MKTNWRRSSGRRRRQASARTILVDLANLPEERQADAYQRARAFIDRYAPLRRPGQLLISLSADLQESAQEMEALTIASELRHAWTAHTQEEQDRVSVFLDSVCEPVTAWAAGEPPPRS